MTLKEIINWILGLLKKPSHINSPLASGSQDWQTPNITNVSQDWTPYMSLPYRTQFTGNFDEDNCATRSAIETIEAILNYYLRNSLFPDNVAIFLNKYYCNSAGYVKLSIRFNAALNGTTQQGNTVDKVWNGFNIDGIIPESIYPDPKPGFTWNDYYSPVPEGLQQYGEFSTKFFKIIWNVIVNNYWGAPDIDKLRQALVKSPLQMLTSGVISEDNGIQTLSGNHLYQHARVLLAEPMGYQLALDSYPYEDYIRKFTVLSPLPTVIQCGVKII